MSFIQGWAINFPRYWYFKFMRLTAGFRNELLFLDPSLITESPMLNWASHCTGEPTSRRGKLNQESQQCGLCPVSATYWWPWNSWPWDSVPPIKNENSHDSLIRLFWWLHWYQDYCHLCYSTFPPSPSFLSSVSVPCTRPGPHVAQLSHPCSAVILSPSTAESLPTYPEYLEN